MEGSAAREAGRISEEELTSLQQCVMPGSGTCGAMFTANTMSTIAEAIGMMLPRGASHPADYDAASDIHDDVKMQSLASVKALYQLIEMGIRPRDIMVREAFENAVATAYAMGGSTNLFLHILAIAREADVPFTIEDIQRVGERVPIIANLQPHGSYAMVALHQVGGVPVVMKALLQAGLLHGDVMTVTGRTLAEIWRTSRCLRICRNRMWSSRLHAHWRHLVTTSVSCPAHARARKLCAEVVRQNA